MNKKIQTSKLGNTTYLKENMTEIIQKIRNTKAQKEQVDSLNKRLD